MDLRRINIEDVKSVFKKVGFEQEECDRCLVWNSPDLNEPLTAEDSVVAELTPEEQGFFRCLGYAYNGKGIDAFLLRALYEIFWGTVRTLHDLPLNDLTVKEGKYLVLYRSNDLN